MHVEIAPNLSPDDRKLVISLFLGRLTELAALDYLPHDTTSAKMLQMRFHRYSGSAYMIGASKLGELLKQLEIRLDTGIDEEYRELVRQLPSVIGEARAMAQFSLRKILR